LAEPIPAGMYKPGYCGRVCPEQVAGVLNAGYREPERFE
jgi:hypothetical protein